MDAKDDMKKIMDNVLAKTQPAKLHFTLGEWAEQCFREQTPLSVETLKAWAHHADRESSDTFVVCALLDEIKDK